MVVGSVYTRDKRNGWVERRRRFRRLFVKKERRALDKQTGARE